MTATTQAFASHPRMPTRPADSLVDRRMVLWHMVAALTFMAISILAGFLFSLQFLQAYPFPNSEVFSPGRWRMVHTNAIAYGFLANAFLAGLHWSIPRLTLKPVYSRKLSMFIFVAWQAVVFATAFGLLAGHAQALEWGETPTYVDPIALVGLVLVAVNFLAPILRAEGPLYVTLWYFIAAFVWTVLVYAMGNFIPQRGGGGDRRLVHSRPGRLVRHAAGLGADVLFRTDHPEETDLEPRAVAGRFLGTRVLLSADRHPSLPLQPYPDVSAAWGDRHDHRHRVRGHDGHHQLLLHAGGTR
jgi:hypothetical protein